MWQRLQEPCFTLKNLDELNYYVHETIAYLTELKDSNGVKLIDGPKKTFTPGFALSLKSILAVAKHLLTKNYNPFWYALTYQFSQDQLDVLQQDTELSGMEQQSKCITVQVGSQGTITIESSSCSFNCQLLCCRRKKTSRSQDVLSYWGDILS